jgi:hypothetical protein
MRTIHSTGERAVFGPGSAQRGASDDEAHLIKWEQLQIVFPSDLSPNLGRYANSLQNKAGTVEALMAVELR